jgi:hypothetical protein
MTAILQVRDQAIAPDQLMPLLKRYALLPHLLREIIIDQAIADIDLSEDDLTAIRHHCQTQAEHHAISDRSALEDAAIRFHKIQAFKRLQWQHQIPSYFLTRKAQLDQVIYSLIRTTDLELANELYFRIQDGEQLFSTLATQYSQGFEAKTGGLVGPIELGNYHEEFAQILAVSPIGWVLLPLELEDWTVIIRVEQRIPAQLDAAMEQRLLDECFDAWLQAQLATLNPPSAG